MSLSAACNIILTDCGDIFPAAAFANFSRNCPKYSALVTRAENTDLRLNASAISARISREESEVGKIALFRISFAILMSFVGCRMSDHLKSQISNLKS